MNKDQKVAVVTGSMGAIGSALVAKLESIGIKCISVDLKGPEKCDFTDIKSVRNLAQKLASEHAQIDYLFNVSGIGVYKSINDLTLEEWTNSLAVNLTAPFVLSKFLISNMSKSKNSPMILNIGSGMGVIPSKGRSAYCSSKFGLRGLSLSLSKELNQLGVDVSLLTLGSVMTPFGTGGIDTRLELRRSGKKYLTVDEVTQKVIEIMKAEIRDSEYVMYPEGYI